MLLIAVASGLIGKFLLKKSSDSLKERKQALSSSGLNASEIERKLFLDSLTVDMIKKWRVVHLPITLILAVLSLLSFLANEKTQRSRNSIHHYFVDGSISTLDA